MDMPYNDPARADPAELWRRVQAGRRGIFARWNFDVADTGMCCCSHFEEAEKPNVRPIFWIPGIMIDPKDRT